jgi:hydroxymethylglutaryl-CoA reductase
VPAEALGGDAVALGIARASRFAELDPARAATHNKGVMNGIDAAALALGQDWRAIEAGAHAWAAHRGRYAPIAVWRRTERGVAGSIELPLAVGIVGGGTHTPAVRAALELVGVGSARELAGVLAAVGLASNLAALRALAGEGIQAGHMKLHARRVEETIAADAACDAAATRGRAEERCDEPSVPREARTRGPGVAPRAAAGIEGGHE